MSAFKPNTELLDSARELIRELAKVKASLDNQQPSPDPTPQPQPAPLPVPPPADTIPDTKPPPMPPPAVQRPPQQKSRAGVGLLVLGGLGIAGWFLLNGGNDG